MFVWVKMTHCAKQKKKVTSFFFTTQVVFKNSPPCPLIYKDNNTDTVQVALMTAVGRAVNSLSELLTTVIKAPREIVILHHTRLLTIAHYIRDIHR